jgi:hypothetical protein
VSEIRLSPEGARRFGKCFAKLEDERQVLREALAELDPAVLG